MVQEDVASPTPEQLHAAEKVAGKRAQTGTEFPYADLEAATELVRAIHSHAGTSAEDDEVAAWMDMSAEGGTFRARRSSARMFGLVDVAGGRITLTALGREIVNDGAGAHAARVEAFLKPELFEKMYEQFRGQVLPPPAAVERHMEQQLGIPPKQKGRARQVFQKSAQHAGYIDQSSGRFVKPGISEPPERRNASEKPGGSGGGGGGGDDTGSRHRLIVGLFESLPPDGATWSAEEAADWLETAAANLRLVYKFKGRIRVEIDSQRGSTPECRDEHLS